MARLAAADRRRQLLEVAATCFADRGYRGTTTAALAEAAGVTEPVLYRHFPSKRDLFVTLVENIGAAVLAAWRERLHGVDDPHERLRLVLSGNPSTDERGRGPYRVIFRALTETHDDPEVDTAIRAHIRSLHTFLAREVKQLQDAGVVRNDSRADELAWLLVDVGLGFGALAPHGLGSGGGRDGTATQGLLRALLRAR